MIIIITNSIVMCCFVCRGNDDLISTLEMFVRSYKEVSSTEPDVSQLRDDLLIVSLFMRLGAARRIRGDLINRGKYHM